MDYERFDKLATARALVGMESQTKSLTIESVCEKCRIPMPVSGEDLTRFVKFCETWGIKTNVSEEPFFG